MDEKHYIVGQKITAKFMVEVRVLASDKDDALYRATDWDMDDIIESGILPDSIETENMYAMRDDDSDDSDE